MEAQVFGLPGLQILAAFLCVFTSHLLKLALAIIRSTHREPATGCRGAVWVRHAEPWWYPYARWGDLWARHSQQLMGRLLDGVHNTVSRICILLMSSKRPICCSPTPSHAAHNSVLRMQQERIGSPWQCPTQLMFTHTLPFHPTGEITGQEGLA